MLLQNAMLTELKIKNILLIDDLCINFDPHFTVITGQTGVGKSILLDSIGIILGHRAETSILRNPKQHGIISATFITDDEKIKSSLYENGFFLNEKENTIIVKKVITRNGSKIFINDIQTTVQFINTIATRLLEIYSQFEQTGLFNVKKHLSILDTFGNIKSDLSTLEKLYNKMVQSENEYFNTKKKIDEQKENLEYLENFIKDMHALNLKDKEYDELIETKKHMVDIEKIATYINNAYSTISNAKIGIIVNKAQNDLQRAKKDITDENNELQKTINFVNESLDKIYNESQNTEEMLADLVNKNCYDDDSIDIIEERISAINDVARKYRLTPYELSKQYEETRNKISSLSISEKSLEKLKTCAKQQKDDYVKKAKEITEIRKKVAKKLEQTVIEKLQKLKMEKVKFYTNFEETEPTKDGIDKVVFFASMNAGLKPAPIHKIASGGELSRFMLAFKSALCKAQETATVIFDEIDTGVSGNVAFAIGQEMSNLSKTTQVVCITHNSQTASCAKKHLLVEKEQNFDIAKTVVRTLSNEERIKVIAEMISCDEVTEEAIQNAKVLLKKAQK